VNVPSIDAGEAHRRLQVDPRPLVLDVREPWEYAAGHIPGAQLVPLGELETRLAEIPRDRPILSICQVGQRSLAAAGFLISQGYRDVTNIDGGTSAWLERGYPLEF
jgi:rhodanese-related sulfurtransferase